MAESQQTLDARRRAYDDYGEFDVASLPPFDPPVGFRFPSEFGPAVPRPIPDAVRRGPYCRLRRQWEIGCVLPGLLVILIGLSEFPRAVEANAPIMAYLAWFGVAILIGGLMMIARGRRSDRRLQYIVEGTPMAALVLAPPKEIEPDQGDAHCQNRIGTLVEYRDPVSGELAGEVILAPFRADRFRGQCPSCTLQPGDYITVVRIRGRSIPELNTHFVDQMIYSQLELNPEHNSLVAQPAFLNRHPISTGFVWNLVLVASLAFILLMCYSIVCAPLHDEDCLQFVKFGALAAVPLIAYMMWKGLQRPSRRWYCSPTLIRILVTPFIAALTSLIFGATLNAILDNSMPTNREAVVTKADVVKSRGIRLTNVTLELLGGSESPWIPIRADRLAAFNKIPGAVVELGKGYFDIPFVRAIHEINCVDMPADWSGPAAVYFERNGTLTTCQLQYVDSAGNAHPISNQLRDLLLSSLVGPDKVGEAKSRIRSHAEGADH